MVVLHEKGLKRHGVVIENQSFGLVINRVEKISDFGNKWGKGFGKWTAHANPPKAPNHQPGFVTNIPGYCSILSAHFFA